MKGSRPLTDQEVTISQQELQRDICRPQQGLFLLGVRTGFRVSELLSLRVEDVCQHGQVVDRVTVHRANMKKK